MASTTTTGIVAKAWTPRTDAERDATREQLDRILGSSAFRNSKRYPALLKFLVDETIGGRGENLKERVVGVEVFGREPDYDTGGDHVVRTSAGEVRKRLAQYYLDAGRGDEIRIDIPTGSYSAQFRLASEVFSATPLAAVSIPLTEIPAGATKWREVRPALLISIAANVVLAIALLVSVAIAGRWGTGASTLEKFWEPVFASRGPVQLVVGLRDGGPGQAVNAANPNGQNDNGASVPLNPLLHRMAMAEVLALTRITRYAGEKHADFRVLDPSSTSFSDLRHEPTVLIGAGNNAWTQQIATRLRFGFQMPASPALRPIAISDRQNPSNNIKWARTYGPSGEDVKDYALVSRLVDPRVEQVLVIIGGLGAHGTEVAGEFVTNPDQMKKLNAFAPSGWGNKNVQIVLSTEVINGSSGPPKIEATYFW